MYISVTHECLLIQWKITRQTWKNSNYERPCLIFPGRLAHKMAWLFQKCEHFPFNVTNKLPIWLKLNVEICRITVLVIGDSFILAKWTPYPPLKKQNLSNTLQSESSCMRWPPDSGQLWNLQYFANLKSGHIKQEITWEDKGEVFDSITVTGTLNSVSGECQAPYCHLGKKSWPQGSAPGLSPSSQLSEGILQWWEK